MTATSLRSVSMPQVRLGRIGQGAVLLVASFGAFLAFLDSTIVNVAFPTIARSFPSAGIGELSWVLNAYNIVFAAFLIAAGRLADLLGRRRAFRLGVLVFTVASVACAVATSVPLLVTLRAVQALGAALLVPASLALVVEAFPAERRSHAVGLWGASAALAAGLGPPIGGALVDVGGWRLAFLVNLPLGIAAWLSARRLLVESRAPGRRTVPDLLGASALAFALGVLTLALVEGNDWGWTSPGVIAAVVSAVLLTGGFVWSSRTHPSPVLDPALLRIPTFATANVLTVLAGAGFYAYLLTHILWLTFVWHWSVIAAGLALAPGAFVAAVVASTLGGVADRYGARVLVVPGAAVWGLAYLWYAGVVGTTPDFLGAWLPGQILSGIGVGCTLPVLGSAALEAVPGGRFATASAVVSSARQLGGVLGISVLVVIVGRPTGVAGVAALRHGWLLSAGCFFAVAVGALALRPVSRAAEVSYDDSDAIPPYPAEPAAVPGPRQQPAVAQPARTVADMLRGVPLFAGLGSALLDSLGRSARPLSVPAGEWLFAQGDPADACYVVQCGRFEVVRDGMPIAVLTGGDVVGELGLLTKSPRAAGVRAVRDGEVVRISRRRFDEAVGRDAQAMRLLAAGLARQVQQSAPVPRQSAPGRTVAVVALDGLVPVGYVAEVLERAIAQVVAVARIDKPDGAALEAAERTADVVLLAVEAVEGEWRNFAIRQADRVLFVGSSSDPTTAPTVQAITDVWLLGEAPPRETVRAWAATGARSVRVLPLRPDSLDGAAVAYAERLTERSVGLVLSGGGARALAHLGVIDELTAAGIRIGSVAGCSMGAYLGAMLACGLTVDEMEDRVFAEFVRRNPIGDYTVPRTALTRGRRGHAMLDRTFGDLHIEELPRTFYTVATDLFRHELVVFDRGLVADAVGASMALPGISPPQTLDGRVLVDGGVLDNLPVGPMIARREGPVVGVNVVEGSNRPAGAVRAPGLQEVVMRAMTMSSAAAASRARDEVRLLITPRHRGVGLLEFHQFARMREEGRRAAQAALADIGGVDALFGNSSVLEGASR